MSIAYVYTEMVGGRRSLAAWFEGEQVAVPGDHRFYDRIVEALQNGDGKRAIELSNLGKGIVNYIRKDSEGNTLPITIVGGKVLYKDRPVNNTVCQRIIEFMVEERSPEPLILFLEKLLLNPSSHSVKQLYKFLEANNVALTERGTILAWKRVRADFTDKHSGKILNMPGTFVEVPRNEVDDDFSNECSYGLHVGSFNFVKDFSYDRDDHILLLEIDPADVVSVPKYDSTKMRVCKYYIIKEVDGDEFRHFSETLYTPKGEAVPVPDTVPYTEPLKVTLTEDEDDEESEEFEEFEFEEEDDEEESDTGFDGEIDDDEEFEEEELIEEEDGYYP